MFEKQSMMYIYVETPLHAGSGRAVGVVDLPIQRERVTNYPLVQSSGVKGRLRAEARERKKEMEIDDAEINAIFGPEAGSIKTDSDAYAGAASFGDARILLFPVRSLYGVFAWTTSANVLARYLRDLTACKAQHDTLDKLNTALKALSSFFGQEERNEREAASKKQEYRRKALISNPSLVSPGEDLILEEFSYRVAHDVPIAELAGYIAGLLPGAGDDEYSYWRNSLPGRLVILPEDDFRDFVTTSTEVVTRVKLNKDSKTVEGGALWSEESLPTDTLLYSPVYIGASRLPKDASGNLKSGVNARDMSAEQVQTELHKLNGKRVRLGGDETVGRGCVCLHLVEGSAT